MLRLSYKFEFCGLSDIGLVRKNNEDVWGASTECQFYLLADGMGGHNAGEIAARQTVELLTKWIVLLDQEGKFNHYSPSEMALKLKQLIKQANSFIYKMNLENKNCQGMGTTLCCLYAYQDQMLYSHIGDSRIYQINKEGMHQLTVDHSLMNELIFSGELKSQDIENFPLKHVLTKSIGIHSNLDPEVQITPLISGDCYLMCSDGLTNYAKFEDIQKIVLIGLKKESTLMQISQDLIDLAKDHGGGDNISVVIVKIANHYE